ncbi:MAG: SDR family NAD(P)-dependent oxidoreductase, partial [Bacteroidota bacterium]
MKQAVRNYFNKRVVWVTGASSGIGEALSKQLVAAGARLIISSHEPEELERVKKEIGDTEDPPLIIPFDLSDPKAVNHATDKVIENVGHVDIFFSNGGVSTRTAAMDTSVE